MNRKRYFSAFAMGLVGLLLFLDTAVAKPEIDAARRWEHPDHTRFVLEMSGDVAYQLFTLTAPNRVVIDFSEVTFDLATGGDNPNAKVGLIKRYRFGLFTPGTSRVVIDLAGPARIKSNFILPPAEGKPHRFVLDLAPTTARAFKAAARQPEAAQVGAQVAATAAPAPPLITQPSTPKARQIIVIDAGHGGVDPGAVGRSGIYEKDVTLRAARELAELLKASGRYDVRLTRQRDIFLPLRERVAHARRAGADLFLSLHADSIARKNLRGAHFYSLSETASDKEAAALAAKENKADLIAGVDLTAYSEDVGDILLDLAQRETNNISADFANTLVATFRGQSQPLLRKAHRQAGFAVLKAPDVPSVLIELGFLSNKQDEAVLRTPAKRRKLLETVRLAVDRHFSDKRIGQNQP